jgi:hypothetical protein
MNKKTESLRASCGTIQNYLNHVEGELLNLKKLRTNLARALANCKDSYNRRLYEQMFEKIEKPYRNQEKRVEAIKKATLKKLMASQ